MAEGTYEYECMRAELLGVEKPNREEFEEKMKLRKETEQEEMLADQLTVMMVLGVNLICFCYTFWKYHSFLEQEVDLNDEQMGSTSGKMDELNSILSITQQRINKFKVV